MTARLQAVEGSKLPPEMHIHIVTDFFGNLHEKSKNKKTCPKCMLSEFSDKYLQKRAEKPAKIKAL